MLIHLFCFFTISGWCFGVADYNTPDIFTGMANKMHTLVRGFAQGEFQGVKLYPTSTDVVNAVLRSENGSYSTDPNLDILGGQLGVLISVGLPIAPLVVFWVLILLLWILWLFAQCCQCCCCRGQKPCCGCGCWTQTGPRPCCVWCTKLCFALITLLMAFFSIVGIIASFQFPTFLGDVDMVFAQTDEIILAINKIGETLKPLPADVTDAVKNIVDFIGNEFHTIDINTPLQKIEDFLNGSVEAVNKVTKAIEELTDGDVTLTNIKEPVDKLVELDTENSGLFKFTYKIPVDMTDPMNPKRDTGKETEFTSAMDPNNVTKLTNVNDVTFASFRSDLTDISKTLKKREDLTPDERIQNVNNALDGLKPFLSNDTDGKGLRGVIQAVKGLPDQVDAFMNDVLTIPGLDVTDKLNEMFEDLEEQAGNTIKFDDIEDNLGAATGSVEQLDILVDYLKYMQNKLFCAGINGTTGESYDGEKSPYCANARGYVDKQNISISTKTSRQNDESDGEVNFPLFETVKDFDPSSSIDTPIIQNALTQVEGIASTFDTAFDNEFQGMIIDFKANFDPADYSDITNTVDEQVSQIIEKIDELEEELSKAIDPLSESLREMENPLGDLQKQWEDNVKPYTSYVDAGSYALAGVFIFMCALYVLQLMCAFCCKSSCCLCCCQCGEFTIFVLFGLVLLLFGILGSVLREVSSFIYEDTGLLSVINDTSLLDDLADLDSLLESVPSDMSISMGEFELDLTFFDDLNASWIKRLLISYLRYSGEDDEEESPIMTLFDDIDQTLDSTVAQLGNETLMSTISEDFVLKHKTLKVINNETNGIVDIIKKILPIVGGVVAPSFVSKLLYGIIDIPFLTLTNTLMLFWLSGLFLFFFFFCHICCMGCGRTYWPKFTPEDGSEEDSQGDDEDSRRKHRRRRRKHEDDEEEDGRRKRHRNRKKRGEDSYAMDRDADGEVVAYKAQEMGEY